MQGKILSTIRHDACSCRRFHSGDTLDNRTGRSRQAATSLRRGVSNYPLSLCQRTGDPDCRLLIGNRMADSIRSLVFFYWPEQAQGLIGNSS